MGGRSTRILLLVLTLLVVGGCTGARPAAPPPVRFVEVDLPAGAAPETIAADGDGLLIGVRRDGQPTAPGMLRRGSDGALTEIPVSASTPYGHTAAWYSITSDGTRILGIGGDRGGAHGNVRWSVWTGTATGVGERTQAFSTFGGWGAGDLADAVLLPAGAALVGSWQSAGAGFDVAVWTPDGDTWTRQSAAGTPLASTPTSLGFVTAATPDEQGILVVGWGVGTGPGKGQVPVVWRSGAGAGGWARTELPDAGSAAAAVAARCAGTGCAVAGRVDGALALWRMADGVWSRVPGVPRIAVGDTEAMPAPLLDAGRLTEVVSDGGQVRVVGVDGPTATVRPVEGPAGEVVAAVEAGGSVYVLAGRDDDSLALWRTDAGALDGTAPS